MHALGIYHTHARRDRDRYVRIHFENVQPALKVNFYKQTGASTFGLPYDYESVMHYGEKAWSKNGLRVLETLDPSKQEKIGQRSGVSELDIKLIKKMYRCD